MCVLLADLSSRSDVVANDFLPYPPEQLSLDPETKKVIKELLAAGKLNRKVVSILGGLKLLPT